MRFIFVLLLFASLTSRSQHPYQHHADAVALRYGASQPDVHYTLTIDTAAALLHVDMKISNAADSFRVAMFVHPEYDDRYYDRVTDLRVQTSSGNGSAIRIEPALWKIKARAGEVIISYNIPFPKPEAFRGAWRPFVGATGALTGGPHAYMYVAGQTLSPSYVHFRLPKNWQIATGLEPTADPSTFFAPTVQVLMDCPVMAGQFSNWSFDVNGVPHSIIYRETAKSVAFDTAQLVNGIRSLVSAAARLFGRLPYKDYRFMLQDEAYGGLEHANSVTLGISSANFSSRLQDYLDEIAHEYFHTWNLVRIRPVEYGDVAYRKQELSKGLWWSEGLTMYYADVLLRRAGLKTASRVLHLQELLNEYYSNPAYAAVSAERLSQSAYAGPAYLGDYDGSIHLQGEVLGTMLDIIIRDATAGKRSMDDVMRAMMQHYSGQQGFTNRNIAEWITRISGRDVNSFFKEHIYGSGAVDVNRYLRLIGLRADVQWSAARDAQGAPLPDRRIWAYASEGHIYLESIRHLNSCWGKAGLHTGDEVISLNDVPVREATAFYAVIRKLNIGDSLPIGIRRKGQLLSIVVKVTGYEQPQVNVVELPTANALRDAWLRGE